MRLWYAVAIFAYLLASTTSHASPPCINPTVQQLEGDWLGVGDAGGVAQLSISRNGQGTLTIHEGPGSSPVSIYRVISVRLDNYNVGFALDPVAWPPETSLSGTFKCGYLTFDRLVVGSTHDAQRFNLQHRDLLLDGVRSVQSDSP